MTAAARPGWLSGFLLGVALQWAAAAPAAIVQSVVELRNPLLAPLSVPVLTAGASVIRIFERTVRAVCGDRPDTMLSNAWWFLLLGAAQASLIAIAIAWRRRRAGTWREPATLGILAMVLLNAALGIPWPWWGS